MQLHELKTTSKRPAKKRIGRGGKRGTYSGRGMKGQKSRAGHRLAPVVREVLKRYPKLKGYRGVQRHRKPQSVPLFVIAKAFGDQDVVSPAALRQKGLVKAVKGKAFAVKIIGEAELKAALNVKGCQATPKAKSSIEKAGGSVA